MACILPTYGLAGFPVHAGASPSGLTAILDRIKAPSFPSRDWDITKFGAMPDGKTKSTNAIQKAIDACSAGGGGRVLIPKGNFLTGAIHLDGNVNLHLADGANLLFSTDPKDYPMVFTRYEGTECMNYSPLIYAFEKTNIAITGNGILDGQAGHENWWSWVRRSSGGAKRGEPSFRSDRDTLVRMGNERTPVKD
ncbi:MAG TPA: glycosyl hydrolase family 28-related protein, partial [Bryobacteraceae bacterium]